MTDRAVDSLCPYCGVGCQIRYHLDDDGRIRWAEGIDGPANHGQLCVKGRFGWDYATHRDRLTVPLVRRDDAPKTPAPANPMSQFREASWDEALDRAANGFKEISALHGPRSLGAFGTAKGSNEEAYLLQKLVRTGFGTNSIDHCARLCHSSSVVALFDQIGSGGVTASFTQCENADVIVIVGANPCRNHPVAAAFFRRAVRSGAFLIVIDPRYGETAEMADLALVPHPGTDITLLNAMAHVICAEGLIDQDFLDARVDGFDAFKAAVTEATPEDASIVCGVAADNIREAARRLGCANAAMIFWGMGVTQHIHGVANARALVNLGLITGNVGRPGTGLHPLRGQNNVQGVSDMGLLPNFLPGYARTDKEKDRERFAESWGASVPDDDGRTIVEMINGAADGTVRGLYFMGENPAMSDPDAGQVRKALCQLDHLVVQDLFLTESAWFADVILPAGSMLEKWGSFTNTNRQIQISRPVFEPPGQARQDIWILQQLARRFGLAWDYGGPRDVWEEIRRVWPAVSGIPWDTLETDGWHQYPAVKAGEPGVDVLFGDRFPTETGRAKLVPVNQTSPAEEPDEDYPYVFMTGRLLEHWHTGVLSRRSQVLDWLEPEAVVFVAPEIANTLNLSIGDPVAISSRRGSISARLRVDPGLSYGTIFMPFCFTEAAANLLTNSALDPQSKIPEYKYCAVSLSSAVTK
jgi:formate dehydrogenase major subunit